MAFKSDAHRRWFFANRDALTSGEREAGDRNERQRLADAANSGLRYRQFKAKDFEPVASRAEIEAGDRFEAEQKAMADYFRKQQQ